MPFQRLALDVQQEPVDLEEMEIEDQAALDLAELDDPLLLEVDEVQEVEAEAPKKSKQKPRAAPKRKSVKKASKAKAKSSSKKSKSKQKPKAATPSKKKKASKATSSKKNEKSKAQGSKKSSSSGKKPQSTQKPASKAKQAQDLAKLHETAKKLAKKTIADAKAKAKAIVGNVSRRAPHLGACLCHYQAKVPGSSCKPKCKPPNPDDLKKEANKYMEVDMPKNNMAEKVDPKTLVRRCPRSAESARTCRSGHQEII